jgi:hypothetical protein
MVVLDVDADETPSLYPRKNWFSPAPISTWPGVAMSRRKIL